jgi:SAM-dependent methyltransferase
MMHGTESVSAWVARWSHLVAPESRVLDLACGAGRHTLHFLKRNCHVTGVDIAQSALDLIANELRQAPSERCRLICADIENQTWPLQDEQFDALIVTNYLWRPLMPRLLASLRPGAIMIYETFSAGNETVGKPSRPDFLLRTGELLELAQTSQLSVIAFEEGFLPQPQRFVQRIVAAAPSAIPEAHPPPEGPLRYPLMP